MFTIKTLVFLGLSATLTMAGPVTIKRDDVAVPEDKTTHPDPTVALPIDEALFAKIWGDVTYESGTLNETAVSADGGLDSGLTKRADFCYDYTLNNDNVQNWGNSWQASSATTWIPASQWRSWSWNDANIKVCAVNRYIAVWDGTDVKSWEIGWAMKSIGWDCYDSWSNTKGGRITGHGTNGRGVHIYLTDVGFTCW
ncbi:hypothetical protein V8F33_009187 [Rhypophila sp. PSN 637]